ncbi:MAG: hypothetical protein H7196_01540 [candidate division SR1 bacterium]|nr:hypothetical protein [candidate division SR1 bacterium]
MPSFSPESMNKLQTLKQGLNKPTLRTPEQTKQKMKSLSDHPDITSTETFYKSKDGLLDKAAIVEMRQKGGDFEYTKFVGLRKETRRDIACINQEEVILEINKALQSFHQMLENADISGTIDWQKPEKRIRLPKFGLDLSLSVDKDGDNKYNILFLGKHIGEILYHPRGHEHLADCGDANALLPHYNIIFDNHPQYGLFHGHLTFIK